MKAYVHSWYLAKLFLEWGMFQTNILEKIEIHIWYLTFPEIRTIYDNVEKLRCSQTRR